jgi:hypothetical protein
VRQSIHVGFRGFGRVAGLLGGHWAYIRGSPPVI